MMESSSSISPMEKLFAEITIDILSRLPIHSLFHCRRVCRSWRRIIRSPEFTFTHFTRSIQTHEESFTKNHRQIGYSDISVLTCLQECFDHRLCNLYFRQLRFPGAAAAEAEDIINCHFTAFLPECQFEVLGSCNGLLCLLDASQHRTPIGVCNPITGEYMKFPDNALARPIQRILSGFGFDNATGEYKVVSIIPEEEEDDDGEVVSCFYRYKTYMLTLGESSWEYVGDSPVIPFPNYLYVLVNGILCWRAFEPHQPFKGYRQFILTFDMAKKEFEVAPPPPDLEQSFTWYLINLEGNLATVSYPCPDIGGSVPDADIWEIGEEEGEISWQKTRVGEKHFGPFMVDLVLQWSRLNLCSDVFSKLPLIKDVVGEVKHVGVLISPMDAINLLRKKENGVLEEVTIAS